MKPKILYDYQLGQLEVSNVGVHVGTPLNSTKESVKTLHTISNLLLPKNHFSNKSLARYLVSNGNAIAKPSTKKEWG